MIRIKNEVFENNLFIDTIRKINDSENLTAKDAYWFNRFSKELAQRMTDYEDIRTKLLKKYGVESPDTPGSFTIEKENTVDFLKDSNELGSEIITIKLEQIVYPENLKLTPNQIGVMENIFDFSILK